jgi:hypothetical protein
MEYFVNCSGAFLAGLFCILGAKIFNPRRQIAVIGMLIGSMLGLVIPYLMCDFLGIVLFMEKTNIISFVNIFMGIIYCCLFFAGAWLAYQFVGTSGFFRLRKILN